MANGPFGGRSGWSGMTPGGRSRGQDRDTPEGDTARVAPSPVSVQRTNPYTGISRGMMVGASPSRKGAWTGRVESPPEGRIAARQDTKRQREQAAIRKAAPAEYRAMVNKRLGRIDTVAKAAPFSAPVTGPLGPVVGVGAAGLSWLAEKGQEGEWGWLGELGLRIATADLPTEEEYLAGRLARTMTADGQLTPEAAKRAAAGNLEGIPQSFADRVLTRRTRASDAIPDIPEGTQPVPAAVRAQQEALLAVERKKKKKTEEEEMEEILNPPLFQQPAVPAIDVGGAVEVPTFLRRVQVDIERARRAGRAEAFI